MKIVFFGTPDYVMKILKDLHKKYVTGPGKSPIAAVVTQSPKPVGRKKVMEYSPVDKWAHERNIPIYYDPAEMLSDNLKADFGVLASYGKIIPKSIINLFSKGILVVHPSLLPKYRGASPIQTAIAAGEKITGVTIFKMDEKVDHGKIIAQSKEEISDSDTFETLRTRLFAKSAEMLIELIEPYLKNKIRLKTQDESLATYTKIVSREDGYVSLKSDSGESIERKIRAFTPWPGVWTRVHLSEADKEARRLKVLNGHLENGEFGADEVQLEGKTPVFWRQFAVSYPQAKFE